MGDIPIVNDESQLESGSQDEKVQAAGQDASIATDKEGKEAITENSTSPGQLVNQAKGDNDSDSILSNIQGSSSQQVIASKQLPQPISIEQQLQKARKDLESMVIKYAMSERENLQNKSKLELLDNKLKRAIKDNDQLANRIKILTSDKSNLTDTLNARVAQLTVLEQKYSYLNDTQGQRLKELEEKSASLEVTNEDLQKQVESYRSKEGELLDFSERLSMKHMMLQAELDEALRLNSSSLDKNLSAKKVNGGGEEEDKVDSEEQTEELLKRIDHLEELLQREQMVIENLKTERVKLEARYQRDIDELENEIKMMRRKHQLSMKGLLKEIKQLNNESKDRVVQ